MATCPNINLDSWKTLVEKEGEDMAYYLWDKYEGTIPESISNIKASPETLNKVKEFLKRNDIQLETLKDSDGKQIGINGAANLLEKLITVAEGKEDVALTEEAMHFAVDMIKSKDPALFKSMMNAIGNTAIYRANFPIYAEKYKTVDGKADIPKIKEEMVGKMLAQTVVEKENSFNETPEFLRKIFDFWDSIKNFFLELVGKAEMNPFAKVAKDVLEMKGDVTGTETFLQTEEQFTQQTKVFNELKTVKGVQIEKVPGKDAEGADTNWYEIQGDKVPNRVTDIPKTFEEHLFKNKQLSISESEIAMNEYKRETGTIYHKMQENIGDVLIDKATGLPLQTPKDDSIYIASLNKTDRVIYKTLKKNFQERIALIEKRHPGSRFLQEATLYDPNYRGKNGKGEAGTVDLMYVTRDGKIGIFDWKFMDLNTKRYTDVPWYKIKAWHLQMAEYKRMLIDVYGIKPEDFIDTDTKMVPILTSYTWTGENKDIKGEVKGIKIGNVDTKLETEDYLLPVGLEEESTGDKKIDRLIKQLYSLYEKESDKLVKGEVEKRKKADILNNIYSAIRHLQIKQDVTPLLIQAQAITNESASYLAYVQGLTINDKLTQEEKSKIADDLGTIQETLLVYSDMDLKLGGIFQGELDEAAKELKQSIRETSTEAREKLAEVNDITNTFLKEIVSKPFGIEDLLSPDRIVKGLQRLFYSTSNLAIKSLQAIYNLRNEAKHKTDFEVSFENDRLEGIEKRFLDWSTKKGISKTSKDLFKLIKKDGKNELIDEYDHNFYTTLRGKIKEEDWAWIRKNIDMKAYEEHLNEKFNEEIFSIENDRHYGGTPEEIQKQKDRLIDRAEREFTLDHEQSFALQDYERVKQFPKRDLWESKEFKELHKAGNEAPLEFYDYINERNEYYASIGYVAAREARIFLPYVEKSFTEKLIFGGKITLGEQFLKNISVDEGTVGFGSIDPTTKEVVQTLPKYFTSGVEGRDYSTDLFRTMGLYNEMAIRFKYLQDIEGQVRALARLERAKEVINTDSFGNVKRDKLTNDIEHIKNTQNVSLVDDMVRAIIYDQKYTSSEAFDAALGTMGDWATKINKKLGYKIFPELEGRVISANKSIDTLNRFFQQKILGINLLSSLSNLLGGNFNAIINAGKHFTRAQFMAAEGRILISKFNGEDGRKIMAALDYFMPLTEGQNREAIKDLSLNKFSQEKVQDWIMSMMRNSDKLVQNTIFIAQLDNLVVIDGEVKNARDVLRGDKNSEWNTRYNLSLEERQKIEDSFEDKVKELVETKGVMKLATLSDEGKFEIPGVKRNSQSIYRARKISQSLASDALGNLTEGDVRAINLNIYGKSFMVFKNWIPRLMDERFGSLHYNSASEAYEMGRTRTFFSALSNQWGLAFNILAKSIALIDGTGTEQAVNVWKAMYEKKVAEYKAETGEELKMTEAEFIDMTRQNIRSQMRDFMFYSVLMAMWLGAQTVIKKGEDKRLRASHNYLVRALDKFSDEIGFFYNPMSFQQILNGSVFPSLGMITDVYKLGASVMKESYGIVIGDEDMVKNAHPVKQVLKSLPITNQLSGYFPMIFPDLAKDLDIKSSSQSRIK